VSQEDRIINRLDKRMGTRKAGFYIASLSGYFDARSGEPSRENRYTGEFREGYIRGWQDGVNVAASLQNGKES
jgi:hypothetical protein